MHLGDGAHQRQADAKSARKRVLAFTTALRKKVEDVRLLLCRHPFALICHRDSQTILRRAG